MPGAPSSFFLLVVRPQAPSSFLLLVAMPGAPSSFLLLVVRPGAPSSFLLLVAMPGAPSSFLLLVVRPGAPSSFLLLVAMPGAPSSFLLLVVRPGAPSSVRSLLVATDHLETSVFVDPQRTEPPPPATKTANASAAQGSTSPGAIPATRRTVMPQRWQSSRGFQSPRLLFDVFGVGCGRVGGHTVSCSGILVSTAQLPTVQ